ncbi:helix-turn-helix domain-containing protein [Anaeromicropila populeti]|uniref:Stage 0 sporulation protein A homolog n=1 Tax=Anaeromicropila populeti TaxID=37658 RepID=A0A1I6I9R4_9FIRM|nr:helix-turn-helix domain-containing protein [Anaeromicropila populeti]SFR63505.1 two component transcriptional regulator, AraC family [Anaeromicropila populeti]
MYKMLIAEQEEEYIEIISEYTSQPAKGIEVVGYPKSGSEVLRLVSELTPDILIISVALQGISGLEVVRRLRKHNSEISIIMLSEYDYYDFIRESINYGVADYLLKPVKKNDLIHVLDRVLDELRQRDLFKEEMRTDKRIRSQIYEFADYSFIYSFLWNGKMDGEIKRYQSLFNLGNRGYVLNLEIVSLGAECVLSMEKDKSILYQTIKDILSDKHVCVVGPVIGNRIIIYISESTQEENYKEHIQLANKLCAEMKRCLNMEVKIGVGNTKKLEAIHDSYEEAIKSLRYKEKGNVIHVNDVLFNSASHNDYITVENKMLQSIKYGKDESLDLFSEILDMLKPLNIDARKNKLFELLVLACHEARMQGENEADNLNYYDFLREVENASWKEVEEKVYRHFEYIIKAIRTSRSDRKSDVVKEALQYINEHFQGELTLDDVSNYVGVTPQHFSKIFKEETGFNYVEWLTNLRIEKAKEYLMEGNKTIKEICYLVGHNDPNYFSRLFKKTVGKSPSEFIKLDKEGLSNSH